MNLNKLFQMQKVLKDRIGYDEPDRRNKLILALLVELGECANEWRGFKFWSKDQQPRVRRARAPYMDLDDADFYNPLLEEYVDGFHFVLELGIDEKVDLSKFSGWVFPEGDIDISEAFLQVFEDVQFFKDLFLYSSLLESYIRLGAALGFTWNDIEQAYMAKNAINHKRQEVGY